jgi:DNA repair ATPase RecN
MKRTTNNRILTVDILILITTEEKLISTEHARMSELIGVRMEITDATLDRARKDEYELATVLKKLEHMRHLDKYYQVSTQATMFLRSEIQDSYNKFTMNNTFSLQG